MKNITLKYTLLIVATTTTIWNPLFPIVQSFITHQYNISPYKSILHNNNNNNNHNKPHNHQHPTSSRNYNLIILFGKSNSDIEPLASEGPWKAYLDDQTTGLIYYFNADTGESLWDPPTSTFPKVRMSRRKKERMMELRKRFNEEQKKKSFNKNSNKNDSSNNNSSSSSKKDLVIPDSAGTGFFGLLGGGFGGDKKKDEGTVVNGSNNNNQKKNEVLSSASTTTIETKSESTENGEKGGFFKSIFATDNNNNSGFSGNSIAVEKGMDVKLKIGSRVLPHPGKVSWGGEDAVFVEGRSFGLFDGVSGAIKLDGIPLYSVTLAQEMKLLSGKSGLSLSSLTSKLLEAAEFADVAATGASTALVASVGTDGYLRALNLGDSYLIVIRDGNVVARTQEIVHYFDCPYQLGEESPDRPKDGTKLEFLLKPGDFVVAGSDGVFDNLDETVICSLIMENAASGKDPAELAKLVSEESRVVSFDPMAVTKYAKQAKKMRYEGFENGVGGKVDDVSCIVVSCT